MNMSPEYMAELHKFLYLSDDSDIERLKAVVSTHLKYSLQGTTQGNGLTGGVPPVRFSM